MPADITTLMGRLLSDADFRSRFFEDGAATLRQLNVDSSTSSVMLQLDQAAIEFQAAGLLNKRFHEVSKLLPETMSHLAQDARPQFELFASTFWPKGHRRHLIDAEHFCRFVAEHVPLRMSYTEQKSIEFALSPHRISLRFLRDTVKQKRRFVLLLQLKLPSQPAPVEYTWTV